MTPPRCHHERTPRRCEHRHPLHAQGARPQTTRGEPAEAWRLQRHRRRCHRCRRCHHHHRHHRHRQLASRATPALRHCTAAQHAGTRPRGYHPPARARHGGAHWGYAAARQRVARTGESAPRRRPSATARISAGSIALLGDGRAPTEPGDRVTAEAAASGASLFELRLAHRVMHSRTSTSQLAVSAADAAWQKNGQEVHRNRGEHRGMSGWGWVGGWVCVIVCVCGGWRGGGGGAHAYAAVRARAHAPEATQTLSRSPVTTNPSRTSRSPPPAAAPGTLDVTPHVSAVPTSRAVAPPRPTAACTVRRPGAAADGAATATRRRSVKRTALVHEVTPAGAHVGCRRNGRTQGLSAACTRPTRAAHAHAPSLPVATLDPSRTNRRPSMHNSSAASPPPRRRQLASNCDIARASRAVGGARDSAGA